jgi:hypothetical protein
MKLIASMWTIPIALCLSGRRSPMNSRHQAMQKAWDSRARGERSQKGVNERIE